MIAIQKTEYSNCILYTFFKGGIEYHSKEIELDDARDFDGWIKSFFSALEIKVVLSGF